MCPFVVQESYLRNTYIQVGVKGEPPKVNGELHKRVIVDDSFWTLEDGDVVVSLQKENKMEWWKCVIVGDPEINTQKVQPENSKLSECEEGNVYACVYVCMHVCYVRS